jgi:type IV secretory pathway VirB4 component
MPEKNKMIRNKVATSTQQYLDIAEIKDNTVIMRDGTLRAVLSISSINFALKSEDEQNAVISSYVGFLNNISSMIQIVIQSRELNIASYLEYLGQREKEQTNKLLKIQTAEYIEYIKELISIGKIMNKRFYVIIPYSPISDQRKSFFASLSEAFRPATSLKLKESKFLKYKEALYRRVDSISSSLMSLGVDVHQLDTQELIELYYKTYNPETSKNQPLVDVNKIRVEA